MRTVGGSFVACKPPMQDSGRCGQINLSATNAVLFVAFFVYLVFLVLQRAVQLRRAVQSIKNSIHFTRESFHVNTSVFSRDLYYHVSGSDQSSSQQALPERRSDGGFGSLIRV